MAKHGVIDADGHVVEPEEIWKRLLPEAFQHVAPRRVLDDRGRVCQFVGGDLKPHIPLPPGDFAPVPGGHDAKVRLADMDGQGIDCSILFPTTGLFFGGVPDAEVQIALCRAYNEWLYEFCGADRERLIGVAVVPQADIRASVAEARRAVLELGFRGVMLRPNPVAGRNLDHPAYAPLWEALEELDVPVAIHEGTTQDLPQSGNDRFENFMFRHVCSHPHEQQIACLLLTCGGVLERHPGLRAVFLESGCGWIAHWLERLDEHVEAWGYASAPLPLMPSEYFARQCFISADPGEKTIPGIVSVIGDENVVFASDYPHPDALADGIVDCIAGREELSEQSIRRILGENAVRCFGL